MATENLEYLDESGLNRTAGNVLAKIAESKEQIEEELNSLSYAKPDGIYPDMTVGAVIGADETAQWATRESTGTGSAIVRSVQGAAIGYNQYQMDSYTISVYGITATVNNGLLTITGTPNTTTTAALALVAGTGLQIPSGHKLLLYNTNNTLTMYVQGLSAYANVGHQFLTADDDTYGKLAFSTPITEGQPVNISAHIMLFDLTAMFGSGNEPTTVAEFERMYPAAYYPYSAPTLKPVQISGFRSTDAQGGELDAIEWTAQTLRAAGSVADVLYADHVDVNVGAATIAIGEGVTFSASDTPNSAGLYNHTLQYTAAAWASSGLGNATYNASYWLVNANSVLGISNATGASGATTAGFQALDNSTRVYFRWPSLLTQAQFEALVAGAGAETLMFALATPTTQPISPALPMTYRVQQGGSESIIVPDGEISAAPIITVAEPVNMGTELAQIWSAIEALQGSRQALQSDVRNDVQEITADLTPIDVIKEVQQTDENREVSE